MSHLYEFGAFRLYPATRVLQKNEQPVSLGGRAFDILVALVRSQGKVISHRQLMAAAWPGLVVDDANVRVQVASLRRLLGGEQENPRFIVCVPGRGYYLAAAVNQLVIDEASESSELNPMCKYLSEINSGGSKADMPFSSLPAPLCDALGRENCIAELSLVIEENRLVTILGGGGTGKTTLAVLTAHALQGFDSKVFVDLSTVQNGEMVLEALASSLGYASPETVLLAGVLDVLSSQKTLILLDNCEHVIEAVASLCLQIVERGHSVHLLLTSREALRIQGERVYLINPLGFPPPLRTLTVEDAVRSPAVQLFMMRAVASGGCTDLSDQDVDKVASLCRRLDGNPLAIGLVASQVGVYGIQGVMDLFASQFALHWHGQRDAPPRHQSVEAAIDWTYALLAERDKFVFSCLSVFVGPFSWGAAIEIISDGEFSGLKVAESLDELINKCLISVGENMGRPYITLAETNRVFASAKLDRSPYRYSAAQRHARYYVKLLKSAQSVQCQDKQAVCSFDPLDVGNVRAAIEWGFSSEGETEQAVEMVRLAVPLFLSNLLVNECARLCDRALRQLPSKFKSTDLELSLLESRAVVYASVGQYDENLVSVLRRGIDISHDLKNNQSTLLLLAGYHVALLGQGCFDTSLDVAQQYAELASSAGTVLERTISGWMLGTSYHFLGDLGAAERAFSKSIGFHKLSASRRPQFFEVKERLIANIGRARVSWALGLMDQAAALARKAISDSRDHPDSFFGCATLCFPILLQSGRREECERLVREMTDISSEYKMGTRYRLPQMLEARLLVSCGRYEEAKTILLDCLYEVPSIRISVARIDGLRALSEASMKCGDWALAVNAANEAIELVLDTGQRFCLADLLIAKAEGMMITPEPLYDEIAKVIAEASDIASQQKALLWELRVAIVTGKLERARGTDMGARAYLKQVYARFVQGLETDELRAAAHILVSA